MMEAVDSSRTEGLLSCNYAIRLLIEITSTTKVRLVSYWHWQVGHRAYVKLHYTCNYSL